jgi:hypothetical protein
VIDVNRAPRALWAKPLACVLAGNVARTRCCRFGPGVGGREGGDGEPDGAVGLEEREGLADVEVAEPGEVGAGELGGGELGLGRVETGGGVGVGRGVGDRTPAWDVALVGQDGRGVSTGTVGTSTPAPSA